MRLVSQASAPAHVSVTDLDRDGINDLLVADLGEFQPGDHRKGAAIWLRGVPAEPAAAAEAMSQATPQPASSSPTQSTPQAGSNAAGPSRAPTPSSAPPSLPPPSPSSATSPSAAARAPAPGAAAATSAPDEALSATTGARGPRALNFLPTIIGNLPRVADVEAADVDEDGVQDLIVSAFGWRRSGELLWMRNETPRVVSPGRGSRPAKAAFAPRTLDARAGAIQAIPVDINRDGHIDLVSVISQEHEEVVALLNDGRARFDERRIYTAPHPNWGSSGIQVVDLDRDGDLDVLLTHGDMFDDFLIKPYHGVQWLENRGTFPFTAHALCSLPGVHRALAVDLDRDSDLDIVAVVLIPEEAKEGQNLPSIVWLEQTSPGQFQRHTLERGAPRHATLDVADYDGDGDVDLLIGNMVGSRPVPAWVELWENVTSRASPPDARGIR